MPPVNASDLLRAHDTGTILPATPSATDPAFDLNAAYAIGAEITRLRRAAGHRTVGLKLGFANRAVWRALKLETLVWAPVYDNTLTYAPDNHASVSIAGRIAPKIEPEIVFRISEPVAPDSDAAAALSAVDGIALGYEIIDCPYPDWKFQPADMVAAAGFHVALVVGQIHRVTAADVPALVDALPRFTLTLSNHGRVVEEGSGKNVLRSPALCLAELASAIPRRPGAEPLVAGELVSTGSLTTATPIAAGDVWRAEVSGLALPALTLELRGA